jgi:FtsP/CotA-like multicopper oxidase with cupredoxin domain
MRRYRWTINGRTFDQEVPLEVRQGECVRLVFDNRSMMFHPMHLHGHTFQLRDGAQPGPRKDTVVVRPMRRVTVDPEADNPGQWVVHCHKCRPPGSRHDDHPVLRSLTWRRHSRTGPVPAGRSNLASAWP